MLIIYLTVDSLENRSLSVSFLFNSGIDIDTNFNQCLKKLEKNMRNLSFVKRKNQLFMLSLNNVPGKFKDVYKYCKMICRLIWFSREIHANFRRNLLLGNFHDGQSDLIIWMWAFAFGPSHVPFRLSQINSRSNSPKKGPITFKTCNENSDDIFPER